MTDLAAALANADLGEFERAAVLSVGIEIPGAAGGLREALKIDPITMHKEDEIMVLLRCKVEKIRFDPVKDSDGWRRVHILSTSNATIVDGAVYEEALDTQAAKIERAKEQAKGVQRLDLPEELLIQHGEGAHDQGLVEGCPTCDEEQAAMDDEAELGEPMPDEDGE